MTLNSNTAHQKLVTRDKEMIPTVLIRAMFILCMAVLVIVAYARLTDRPLSAAPPSEDVVPPVAERLIRISGDIDGSAMVWDANGEVIADFATGEGGFVSTVHRVLERRRLASGLGDDAPIRLVRYEDGRVSLRDPLTDFRVELIGFGSDNAAVFARFLEDEEG